MVINNCNHSGEFELIYDAGVEHYMFRCERCKVLKLNFNPVEAGKIGVGYSREEATGDMIPSWKFLVVTLIKKDGAEQLLPRLSTGGKF